MITFTCDVCGKEIDVDKYFSELKVRRISNFLAPTSDKKNMLIPKTTEDIFHFCSGCLDRILKLCQNKKGGQ